MYRTLDDFGDRYVVVPPEEGVSLATLGVLPYSPPDPAWEDDDRMPVAPDIEAPGISFADLVRPISPVAEPGVWREDNSVPFRSPHDPRGFSGPSFDDYVTIIGPSVDPDMWLEYSAPQYDSYPVPFDPRAAALGAFRIPGLPEGGAEVVAAPVGPLGHQAAAIGTFPAQTRLEKAQMARS